MESARPDTAMARLAALRENLTGRHITTRLDDGALAVLNPDGDEQVDTITCKRRPSDGDQWWFWDCMNSPIAPADDVIDSALIIIGMMRRSGIRA